MQAASLLRGTQRGVGLPGGRSRLPAALGARRAAPVARARRSTGAVEPSDGGADAAPKKRGRKPKTVAGEPEAPAPAAGAPDAAEAAGEAGGGAAARKRGRKTKAELEELAAAGVEEPEGLDEDEDDERGRSAAPAPAQGPGSWAEAAASTAGEEDRRRFPFHRRIHAAALAGNVDGAAAAFDQMAAAGLPPGPRAYHVLLCAHLKAGDLQGGLAVTQRATAAGVQLLPESYAALIFAHMELSPPEPGVAKSLYAALAGTGAPAQLPWAVLCRLLSAKGFAADAAAAVREGLAGGLALDADVAEAYVKALCDLGEMDAALKVLEGLSARYGFRPEARHVNYVVAAEALAGNMPDAAGLVDAAGSRGWGRDAGTFNALLAGLVAQLAQAQAAASDELVNDFTMTRARMVQSGVRPDKHTFRLEAEGHIHLGDPRSAMAALKSMRSMAGAMGCRLMDGGALAALLRLLSAADMPVDLLQLLVFMSEDGCRLPPGALARDAEGRTLLSSWLLGHMEGIATRAEARESEAAMLAADIEYVNGVAIGPGRCVVGDDGLVVPLAKATLKQLRAEAEARGVADPGAMKRPELTAALKAARARLPFNVLKAQVALPEGAPAGGRKKKATTKAAAAKASKGARGWEAELWSLDERGDVETRPVARQLVEADQFLLDGAALGGIDTMDDQFRVASNKAIKDVNLEAVMEARMLDEGTAAVMNVGDEDVASGFATLLPGSGDDDDEDDEDESRRGAKEGELDEAAWRKMQSFEARAHDPQTLQEGYAQLQFLEAAQLDTDEANLVAGMDVALDVLRVAEVLGGAASPADVLALAAGAQAERSPAAAAAVAPRLAALLEPGAGLARDEVAAQYEALADMCLRYAAPGAADVVLEAAEAAGLRPADALLARLRAALRGQPRRGERLGMENAALLERAGVDTTDEDLQLQLQRQQDGGQADDAAQQEHQQQQEQQQQQQQLAEPPVTDVQALAAAETPLDGGAAAPAAAEADGAAASEEEAEEYEEALDDPAMAAMAELYEGIAAMGQRREMLAETLVRGAGLSPDDASELLDMPEALLQDMHWVPSVLLTPEDDGGVAEAAAAAAAAARAAAAAAGEGEGEGEGGDGAEAPPPPPQTMTLLQLAHAAANDSLSPEAQEWLLEQAEAHGLPLMLDEASGKLVWPGTPEYKEWAAEAEEEADADWDVMMQALQEVMGEQMDGAERAAEALMQEYVDDETGDFKPLPEEQRQQLEAMQQMFLERLQRSGSLELVRQAGSDVLDGRMRPGGKLDAEVELAAVAAAMGPSAGAKRAALSAELLEEMGMDPRQLPASSGEPKRLGGAGS
ncbi:pentatricopeptide repeat-containing protein [Scenedesmus sp. PABB004]|nr:pentatricopeptide repeat-containing protein [Scenedesmus sp. PABB004]